MTHLLDTNICSAHMKRPGGLAHRFFQHAGGLAISTVILAELHAGAYKHPTPDRLLTLIADLLQEVTILDFDEACAQEFGKVKGGLGQQGCLRTRRGPPDRFGRPGPRFDPRHSQYGRFPEHPRLAARRLADALTRSVAPRLSKMCRAS